MPAIRLARILGGTIAAATVVALTATPAFAADLRAGDTVSVSMDEQVDSDLYLAGRVISSHAAVIGDVYAAGETLQIGGSIDGGLSAAGEFIHIDGIIARGARLAGSEVDVMGHVERDVLVGSSEFALGPDASIGQDLYFGAGTITLSGDIGGDVQGGAEKLVIEGTVRGNVDVEVGTLVIDPGARISGDLTYRSREEASIPAGTVEGAISYSPHTEARVFSGALRNIDSLAPLAVFASIIWKISWYLMTLLVGIVVILLAPRRLAGATMAMRTDTGAVAGWGAIALFVTPIAAVVLCLTFIGLPLGIIMLLLWGILLYLAQLPVSLLIGHLLLGHRKTLAGKGFMIGALALGLFLLTLLRMIPAIGFFISLATALFGIGGMVVFERRLVRSRQSSSIDTANG